MEYWDYYFQRTPEEIEQRKKMIQENSKKYHKSKKKKLMTRMPLSTFLAIITSSFVCGACFSKCHFDNKKEVEKNTQATTTTKAYSRSQDFGLSKLYDCIQSNTNLDDIEKRIIDNSWTFMDDYKQYLEYDDVGRRLYNFDIEYLEHPRDIEFAYAGTWNVSNNIMTLYNVNSKEDILQTSHAANHEFIHLLTCHGKGFPSLLTEGITELICNEYSLTTEGIYGQQVLIARMLCEVLGEDTVIECYIKEDFNSLKNKLLEIDDNKEQLNSFIDYLDKFQNNYYAFLPMIGLPLDDNQKETFIKYYYDANSYMVEMAKILSNYYSTKTNRLVVSVDELGIFRNEEVKPNYDYLMGIYRTMANSFTLNYDEVNRIFYSSTIYSVDSNYFNKRKKDNHVLIKANDYKFIFNNSTNEFE